MSLLVHQWVSVGLGPDGVEMRPDRLDKVDVAPDPDAEDIKDVLLVISLYEHDTVCDNSLIDDETGLDPATVD